MSLISDTDFLIHSLRLNYLRNVEDPYGPRLISLSPSYTSNPYVLAASLADVDRWPELAAPVSPQPSDDEGTSSKPTASGFPGSTGLKHTQTIMGPSRTGALGMRVSGKRNSTATARSVRASRETVVRSPSPPPEPSPSTSTSTAPLTTTTTVSTLEQATPTEGPMPASDHASPERPIPSERNPAPTPSPAPASAPADAKPVTPVAFVPRFKGAAEMEARRRQRMVVRARTAQGGGVAGPPLSFDSSSSSSSSASDEEAVVASSSSDDDYGVMDGDDSMDSGGDDDFDPEFAPPRPVASWNPASVASSDPSLSASSVASPPPSSVRQHRPSLSPVAETKSPMRARRAPSSISDTSGAPSRPGDSVSPLQTHGPSAAGRHAPHARGASTPALRTAAAPASSAPSTMSLPLPLPDELAFARRPVGPAQSQKSLLTEILAASSAKSANPFTELYGAISGRAETASMNVRVYFPHARAPEGHALDLKVRKDATVEEVLGFALWSYWEEGWLPKLEQMVNGDEDPRLSAVGWILRIAEDDGEVDEDFPPPDRTAKIAKFNFAYAILEASVAQVQQNVVFESKIQRRPSRIMIAKKKVTEASTPGGGLAAPSIAGTGTSAAAGSTLATSVGLLSTSLGPSSSYGPQMFLRIRIADAVDSVHFSTTVPVSSGMYMQEVLEMVCRRRKLPNPNDYALILEEILIPLDRTVASLQGKSDLLLVKRTMLPGLGIEVEVGSRARATDPNASIFKRMSEVPDPVFGAAAVDYSAAYKRYNVVKKMPMLGRHERTLAIDGVYVHLMPSTSKARAVFENARTMSYHIKSIASCQQSTKSSSTFKLVIHRGGGAKRYEFEAENAKLAAEIVTTIRGLKATLEKSGSGNKSRRSRQVV